MARAPNRGATLARSWPLANNWFLLRTAVRPVRWGDCSKCLRGIRAIPANLAAIAPPYLYDVEANQCIGRSVLRAIIIGAGRGSRLMPATADAPKCFARVGRRRILDWSLAAFRECGLDDIAFIGGYQIDKVRAAYPELVFRHNERWESNNILASLFHAEDLMDGPFVCCYSDTLFRPSVVAGLIACESPMGLSVDTDWLGRYAERTEHPSDDAEKVTVENGLVTRIHRDIAEDEAHGEFTGMARFSAEGAARLREHYHDNRRRYDGRIFGDGRTFEKAYLIQLFQKMIEAGERFAHVDTRGGYLEIDTQQDYDYARRYWATDESDRESPQPTEATTR
ncbi:MAG TPA: nucleotidyl transferase [Planctomycetaceae bacterium]|nr:nucleotidyl transferase [Planctomycetaceae bacterium]